jgi:hypothetical protein
MSKQFRNVPFLSYERYFCFLSSFFPGLFKGMIGRRAFILSDL